MDDTQRIELSKLIINELEIETRNEKKNESFYWQLYHHHQ